ncbi:hypothetical protein QBC35DRAFT_45089 [Podospora australis]|uniref:Uncharacterized protein n=1 Tax=Podospora australis TaxID=1536484 RepID=A0AAN6WZQ0_9PEZI|nr:hypothetical protein QBC35DRAFT_45089 [Podospora australis]
MGFCTNRASPPWPTSIGLVALAAASQVSRKTGGAVHITLGFAIEIVDGPLKPDLALEVCPIRLQSPQCEACPSSAPSCSPSTIETGVLFVSFGFLQQFPVFGRWEKKEGTCKTLLGSPQLQAVSWWAERCCGAPHTPARPRESDSRARPFSLIPDRCLPGFGAVARLSAARSPLWRFLAEGQVPHNGSETDPVLSFPGERRDSHRRFVGELVGPKITFGDFSYEARNR